MRIAKVEVFPIRLPIQAVLTLPRGPSRTVAEGKRLAVVKVTGDDGTVGWGETGPSPRWSAETIESAVTSLRRYLAPAVIGHDGFDIAGLHERMNRELASGFDAGQPIAKSAIDIAVHDLVCRRLGISLSDWLGAKRLTKISLARLVSAPTPDEAAAITATAVAAGFPGLKVKVGGDVAKDAAILSAVVAAAKGRFVWPDANQGFSAEDALILARTCEKLGIAMFEQPLASTDYGGLRRLMAATPVTIVIDEGAISLPVVIELLRQGLSPGIAVKVMKLGGIHYARQMCELARNAGLALIGSGLMDAPIGFATGVHVFAAYGMSLPADLNGPQFITDDYLARPIPREGEVVPVPTAPGLGIEIDEQKLARFALSVELT
jgi:muconate cycloisomerase